MQNLFSFFLSSEADQQPSHLFSVGAVLADDNVKSTMLMKGLQFFCSLDSLGFAKLALACGQWKKLVSLTLKIERNLGFSAPPLGQVLKSKEKNRRPMKAE